MDRGRALVRSLERARARFENVEASLAIVQGDVRFTDAFLPQCKLQRSLGLGKHSQDPRSSQLYPLAAASSCRCDSHRLSLPISQGSPEPFERAEAEMLQPDRAVPGL